MKYDTADVATVNFAPPLSPPQLNWLVSEQKE